MPGTVGVIVNPVAGKDIRRLVTAASHTSDSSKIDVVRRAVIAALESGASRVLVAPDPHHLGQRAITGLGCRAHVLRAEVSGSRYDTIAAARSLRDEGVECLIALGGDGTCRDVALGWADAPLIAISTGTNNVYPSPVDATSAGAAAGFIASGGIDVADVSRRSKRICTTISTSSGDIEDLALIDLALIDTTFVGSRAVLDPATVRLVIASSASPATTGLSSIAGRLHPCGRWDAGGVLVRLGPGGRPVRVPLGPGSFTTVNVTEIVPLANGEVVEVRGPGVLAFDGERDRRIGGDVVVSARVEPSGPRLVDVEAALLAAAAGDLFDERPDHRLATHEHPHHPHGEGHHGQ